MTIRMLAISTVTDLCSVALIVDQKIYDYCVFAPQLHAENVLSIIHKLLINTDVILKSLNCIIFDQGPGSFMGMRLGLSIALGLALGSDLPLVSVNSLEVLAQKAWRIFGYKNVITTINARIHELYWARFSLKNNNKVNSNQWVCMHHPCLVNAKIARKFIYELKGQWILVGTGWNKSFRLISNINNKVNTIVLKKKMLPTAKDMLPLGKNLYQKKLFFTLEKNDLIYMHTNTFKNSLNKKL